MATVKKAQNGGTTRDSYKVSGGDYKVVTKRKSTPSGIETKAKLKRTLKGALKGVTKGSNLSKPIKTKTPPAEFDIPESRFGSRIKKAQYGDRITGRQERRLGRISEKNPDKAKEIAERMRLRATRKKRGRELYKSLAPKEDLPAFKARTMEEARDNKKAQGGKVKKAQAGLTASNKRVGPIDPKGAWTKVQEMTIAGKKTPVSLKKDKQLGATKMKSGGKMKKKK